MGKTGEYDIPFDHYGNQQHYPQREYLKDGFRDSTWRPNTVFANVLTYKGYSRGRSAAYFTFATQSGTTVSMFLTDLEDAIPFMVRGVLTGEFTFVKRGQNYGARFVP